MIGIGKDDEPLHEDARPIVIGEYWRRLAGKLALASESEGLRGWLKPSQVAVGARSGQRFWYIRCGSDASAIGTTRI